MLDTLQIKNLALIDDVEVAFGDGFNVLTGETGAGKSIVVNALALVLGARASASAVRSGAKNAKVDAIFRFTDGLPGDVVALLDEHGVDVAGQELHLSRVVSAEGRSRAYVNGSLLPISILSRIGDELVDLHGQHDHQSLLMPSKQLQLLDAFGGLNSSTSALTDTVHTLRSIATELEGLEQNDREQTRRIEFLEFEKSEIDEAGLAPDEEAALRARRDRGMNFESIRSLRASLRTTFDGDDDQPSTLDLLAQGLTALEELAKLDAASTPDREEFESAYRMLEALAENYRGDDDEDEIGPEELDSLNRRLSQLSDLKRKYGDSVDAVLAYRDRIAQEIENWRGRDERIAELTAARDKKYAEAMRAAEKLSIDRKGIAKKLDKAVTSILRTLGMESGKFVTHFETGPLTLEGIDRVTFMISANAGEAPKPLKAVASGGEISRTMLAIKSVFASVDPVGTLIFDEIDTGVGGAVANQVGAALANLAGARQVLCVTHLASIAARSDHHFRVTKSQARGRTRTDVAALVDEGRAEEIARLLDGGISPTSLEHARSLLGEVRKESA